MTQKLIRFDCAIKSLLRQKSNFDVLEGFLPALLEDNEIRVIKILERETNQEEENSKFNRVNILVEDNQKRKIIIEVQSTRESDYLERLLFGTSKTIVDNLKLGERYKKIHKIISISILYFNLGIGDDYLYKGITEFRGLNTNNSLIVKEKIETTDKYGQIHITFKKKDIFPEYDLIRVEKYQNIVKKAVDEWVYLFKNNTVKEEFTSKNIDKAAQKLAKINMSETGKKAYERYLDSLARENDQIETAKQEGKEKPQIDIVIKSFQNNISVEIIQKITGLNKAIIIDILQRNGLIS